MGRGKGLSTRQVAQDKNTAKIKTAEVNAWMTEPRGHQRKQGLQGTDDLPKQSLLWKTLRNRLLTKNR